jgi:hypothetical protein
MSTDAGAQGNHRRHARVFTGATGPRTGDRGQPVRLPRPCENPLTTWTADRFADKPVLQYVLRTAELARRNRDRPQPTHVV